MADYVDDVVIPYDQDLGPVLFEHYGLDTAKRFAALAEAFRRELGANPTRYPMQAILF